MSILNFLVPLSEISKHTFWYVVIPTAVAAAVSAVVHTTDGAAEWIGSNLHSTELLSATGTLLGFLLVGRQQSNLSRNEDVFKRYHIVASLFNELFEMSSLDGFALNCDGFVPDCVNGKDLKFDVATYIRTVAETRGGLNSTEKEVIQLLNLQKRVYSRCSDTKAYSGDPGAYERRLSVVKKRCSALFHELFLLDGVVRYRFPRAIKYLANIVLALYLGLLIVTDVVPNNGFQSVWMVAVISFAVSSVYAVATVHSNPLKRVASQSVQRRVLDGLLVAKGSLNNGIPHKNIQSFGANIRGNEFKIVLDAKEMCPLMSRRVH